MYQIKQVPIWGKLSVKGMYILVESIGLDGIHGKIYDCNERKVYQLLWTDLSLVDKLGMRVVIWFEGVKPPRMVADYFIPEEIFEPSWVRLRGDRLFAFIERRDLHDKSMTGTIHDFEERTAYPGKWNADGSAFKRPQPLPCQFCILEWLKAPPILPQLPTK